MVAKATDRQPLPHEPETIEQAKARYPLAVRRSYTFAEAAAEQFGRQRKHVFDFEDGMRLIISREKFWLNGSIHVSASRLCANIPLITLFVEPALRDALLLNVRSRFREISGNHNDFVLVLIDEGIPHFAVKH